MMTLAELASHFDLYAVCGDCRRMVRVDLHLLAATLGGQATTDDVRARLRCRACGRRTHDLRIVYAGPCGGARVFHHRGAGPRGAGGSSGPS
jgi:hypothetical protein